MPTPLATDFEAAGDNWHPPTMGDIDTMAPPTLEHRDGRPWHVWPDGTTLPVIAGGEGPGDGDGDGDGSDAGGSDDGSDDGTGDDGSGDGGDDTGGEDDEDKKKGPGVKFTAEQQAELDRLLSERARRAERRGREAAAAELAEQRRREGLDEAERHKLELEEERGKAKTVAQQRDAGDAALVAAMAGVDPNKAVRFVKVALADGLDELDRDDKGRIAIDALKAAVRAGLKEYPEFAARRGGEDLPGRSGGDHGADRPPAEPATLEEAFAAKMQAKR